MHVYALALFAHILGVLGLFIAMGLQWLVAVRLQRAQTIGEAREWSSLIGIVGKMGPASGALVVVAGVYMTLARWSVQAPWIVVSLGAMVVMMALGMGVTTRRMKAVHRAALAEPEGEWISQGLWRQINDPVLWIAAHTAGSIALGVVFLMTTKPGLSGSLLVVAVALALGVGVGAITAKRRQEPSEPAIALEDAIHS